MLDDLESNIMKDDNIESTSNKFSLKHFNLPGSQQNINILSMSASKKFIYLVTDHSELLRIESNTLEPIQQAYSIKSSENENSIKFHEPLTKIWTDREGNHSIIRYNGRIYYFNSSGSNVKELNSLKDVEVCAVGFDDRNNNTENTGYFLVSDFNNNIYECNISIGKIETNGDYQVKDSKEILTTLSFKDWDEEDDEIEPRRKEFDRIYSIKFFRATKIKPEKEKNLNENECYIIAVTKNKLYQFRGPGITSFKQIFVSYNNNPSLFNDSCKYFPPKLRRKGKFNGTDLDIIYKNEKRNVGEKEPKMIEVFKQFGWKTESGYCFGDFKYDNSVKSNGLPNEINNFTVIPFEKINSKGIKETEVEPICVVHSINHIFILYEECLTVISKLTSNIVHTQYFQIKYELMLYNEFAKDNGIILLTSKNGLYQISLKDENIDIWKDYLEIGDYMKAQNFCDSNKLKKKIYRIDAEYEFDEKKNGINAANKFANSDEKFEIICLKYLMRNDIEGLNLFLKVYMETNLNKKENNLFKNKIDKSEEEDKLQLNLICTWLLEIFINIQKKNKSNLEDFRLLIRKNREYLDKDLIYQLLLSYGKIDEFIEFASIMGDFEKVILYHINQGEIGAALERLTWFASFEENKEIIKELTKIFSDNCHIFFKKNPKEAISLIQQRFKNVKMPIIVQAILSTTDKDDFDDNKLEDVDNKDKNIIQNKDKIKKAENTQAILNYLKSLVEKPNIEEEENNIHNLYIYYLSRNKANQKAILEYLKGLLKKDDNQFIIGNNKKKEILFQLDYAKKLFKDNPPAYSLVLALMGKYSEAVRSALNQKNEECLQIAKFISSNAPGEKLKKKLWIDIFSEDNKNEFKKGTLNIMKESKILKIEDVLPHINDSIKIEEFKKQISHCINEYETNISKLKEDISEYNKTSENIKNDIYKVKKKSMEIQYTNCKCDICQGYIKDKNIFLFPCGHMFDMNCIRDYLLDYEITGLDNIHKKNVRIDELLYELGYETKRTFIKHNENSENEIETKNTEDIESRANTFFNKIKNLDFTGFIKQENQETKKPIQTKALKDELNEILSEQCILCGDFMVDSIQCSLYQRNNLKSDKDGLNLQIIQDPEFQL